MQVAKWGVNIPKTSNSVFSGILVNRVTSWDPLIVYCRIKLKTWYYRCSSLQLLSKYFHRAKFPPFHFPLSLFSFSSKFQITFPLLHFQWCMYRKSEVLNEDEMNIPWSKTKYQGLSDSSPVTASFVTIGIFTVNCPYFRDLLPGANSALSLSIFHVHSQICSF